jgi:hypothetical protein
VQIEVLGVRGEYCGEFQNTDGECGAGQRKNVARYYIHSILRAASVAKIALQT